MSGESAWARAMSALAAAGDRLAGEMQSRGGSVDPADVYTTMLGALMDSYVNQIGLSPDRPSFVPCTGWFQRLGSPNPDTVYRRAPVDPKGVYRLTGMRGTARDVTIMPFTQAMRGLHPFDLSGIATSPEGTFELIVSAERPKGHDGDCWRLDPETASLWLREVSDRWGEDVPAQIAIVRLDAPPYVRPSAKAFDAQLAGLATRVERIVEYGMLHVDGLVRDGHINAFKQVDYGASGAMPLQFYHEGLFELGEGQGLLIEARMPSDCSYFSWSLTDSMLVTLDWMNFQSSLNSAQALADSDGVLRAVVSKSDRGTPNWLDTLGYDRGVVQCRSVGSPIAPVFSVEVVNLDTVFSRLPKGTARVSREDRQTKLRERQRAWQLRRLW